MMGSGDQRGWGVGGKIGELEGGGETEILHRFSLQTYIDFLSKVNIRFSVKFTCPLMFKG